MSISLDNKIVAVDSNYLYLRQIIEMSVNKKIKIKWLMKLVWSAFGTMNAVF